MDEKVIDVPTRIQDNDYYLVFTSNKLSTNN